ncbi:MAG: SapC family protein, partial [Bosea sp. (in: a-proteobacteria)]
TVEHRTLRIRTEKSGALGDAVMACITFPSEFRNIQNHYPIVFQLNAERESFAILALLGFENGENLFLADGKWDARYRPLTIEIQPFLIGRSRTPDGVKQVHIDLASPKISFDSGTRVLDENGQPTPFLEAVTDKLGIVDEGYQASAPYLDCLRKYDLLEPFSLDIKLDNGASNRLIGFHTINEENLRQLDSVALGEMHAAGHLFPTFMAVASLSNLAALVDRKNRLLDNG